MSTSFAFISSSSNQCCVTDLLSVKNLYFAGQRTIMPGGLPIAVVSGRKAVQYLCRDNNVMFRSAE